VIPPLYNRLKKFGNGIVSEQIETETEIAHDSHLSKFLLRVWEVYGHMTGAQLSYLTHMPETPWAIVWAKERFGVIPNDEIRKHFSGLMAQ
jgi:uncharacterized phage-associated protein